VGDTRSRLGGALIASFFAAGPAHGAEDAASAEPRFTGTITGYYYSMRDQPDFGVGIATLDRGPLHLEMRYNYEVHNAGSAFVGWKFSGGDEISFELTPIIGAMFGAARGAVPGLEASLGWLDFDAYIEAEYVHDLRDSAPGYYYAWGELAWKPIPWLRVGFAGQRTHEVETGRDLQRGVFAQATAAKLTLSVYAFNPDSASRYVIVALGARF
jgi:hypothetical protein